MEFKVDDVVRIKPEARMPDESDELYVVRSIIGSDVIVSAVALLNWPIPPTHRFPADILELTNG